MDPTLEDPAVDAPLGPCGALGPFLNQTFPLNLRFLQSFEDLF